MANVKFKKSGGNWYVTFNNNKLLKAKVKMTMVWDTDPQGYKQAFECVTVNGSGSNNITKKCKTGKDSGETSLEFTIDRNSREDYKLTFDTTTNAERGGSDYDTLILNHPLISQLDVKKQITLQKDGNDDWGVSIPGQRAVIGGTVTLYMERVDNPDTYGTALDAVEVTGSDGNKGRMSFKNQKKDSATETFKIESRAEQFYKLDLIGLEKRPKEANGAGDWTDGETFPPGQRLEFRDKDGNDVNAYLHIKNRNPEVNTRNLEGARFILTTSNEEFFETPPPSGCSKTLTPVLVCPGEGRANSSFKIVAEAQGVNKDDVKFTWYKGSVSGGDVVGSSRNYNGIYPKAGESQKYTCQMVYKKGACDITKKASCTVSAEPLPGDPCLTANCKPSKCQKCVKGDCVYNCDSDQICDNGSCVDVLDPLPSFALILSGYNNKQIKEYTEFVSAQPTVQNSTGNVTFELVAGNGTATEPGFTINSGNGVVKGTAPAFNNSGSNDYTYKVRATDSGSTPKSDTQKKTLTVTKENVPDIPSGGGGTCGVDPPRIRFQDGNWGVLIPDKVISGSELTLDAAKDDNPSTNGTALSTLSVTGSDGEKKTIELDKNKEKDDSRITIQVKSSKKTFYPFRNLDNIRDPYYNESRERLEFRDTDSEDANAWVEINDAKTKFICDEIPGDPPTNCQPGNLEINGEVYYPENYPEPQKPSLVETSGGLRASVDPDDTLIRVNFKNYGNKLLTLKLTWKTNSDWGQECVSSNKYISDLMITGPSPSKGGSRYGEADNEYNMPDYTLLKVEENVTKYLYLYNVDGGDYDATFKMSSTPGPEPVRETAEQGSTTSEGLVVGISIRDEMGDLGDDYTQWTGDQTQAFKNNDGENSPPNWPDGTAEVTSFTEFTMTGGSGSGLKVRAKIEAIVSAAGIPNGDTEVKISEISDPGTGYKTGDKVTFPPPYNIDGVIKISAISSTTDYFCEFTGTETWTEAGGSWPRYEPGVALTKNGGNKVEWAYEDGQGGTWNKQLFTLEIVGTRDTVPWTGNLSMDKHIQNYVWINSTILETGDAGPDGEPGHSLEDYHIHSDKVRFRRPLTHSSLINLPIGGTTMDEFRGVAGAKKPEEYGL